jgi:uncharacterized membrane protein YczE
MTEPTPSPAPNLVDDVIDTARTGQSRNQPNGIPAIVAAILLGVACTVWSTLPEIHKAGPTFLLILTISCVAGSALRLSLAWIPLPDETYLMAAPMRGWLRFLRSIRLPPWEEGAAITIIWLELLHRSRPWHTFVLGAALIAYLITVHLAESGASPATLRPQVPVLAVGACLLALGAGAGMLPATAPGAGSALLRVVAAIAVIIAAGLVLPHVTTRSRK